MTEPRRYCDTGTRSRMRELISQHEIYDVWRETSRVSFTAEVISAGGDPETSEDLVDELNNLSGELVTIDIAYTKDGHYIGTPQDAEYLCVERGIKPEVRIGKNVCSIGFCEHEQKWYGWSHRAMYGFGIGDVVSEGDCTAISRLTDEYLSEHPEKDLSLPVGFKAKTLEDAKRMAIAFADSVS